MEDIMTSVAIGAFLHGLTQLIILIACIIILVKQKSPASLILLIGAILMIVVSIAGIIWPITAKGSPEDLINIQGALSILRGITYLVFGVGILLLSINNMNKKASSSN